MRTLTVLTPALALVACELPPDEFRQVLPDDRLIVEHNDMSAQMRATGEPSEYYELTEQLVTDTNTAISDVLTLLDTVTSFPPTWGDETQQTALWGPWMDEQVMGQLWVQKQEDGSHAWAFEFREVDSAEDAWVPVLGGEVDPGATELASSGTFAMDFTALSGFGQDELTGSLAVEYDLFENGAEHTTYFGDVSEDGSIPANAGAHFAYEEGGDGLMDVVIEADISEPPNGSTEVTILRSRWNNEGAGRTDAYLTQGDLGDLVFTETECWSAAHTVVFHENNADLTRSGDEADCAFTEASFNE
ncbi:MAG: hypothetical protein KTR31_05210 [Myxococcales bacterium]|nr:hypothetical protein [Myxococcales bacterium]